ncbi:thioesterase II family protein [Streptomyces sp. HMX112]|uniref:thioesterase II family protein n=1 Tax=Streptomyces sp. HMX112 TaxID=3390850 RepID=UPI003A80C747
MHPSSRSAVRLYCFPHAGATSLVYRPWITPGGPLLRVHGVDQPGRGTRIREPKATDFDTLVAAMADHVAADLVQARADDPDVRYATFGHSFGAMVSLAVGAAVARSTGQAPVRAVLSAALPPALQQPDDTDSLTDEELLAKIAEDGGTAPELLSSSAMSRYLVRLMREDYVVRRQFPQHKALRVDHPLTLIAAREDAYVAPDHMWQWSEHTTGACRRVEIPGGHFAAIQNPKDVLAIVAEDVADRAGAGER